jgi:hypothetical protein
MNEYRKALPKANAIIDRAKADRKAIINSGLQEWKIKEDLRALGDRTKLEVLMLGKELQEIANLQVSTMKKITDEQRRRGKDTSLMTYHQGRARDSFKGLNPEDILKKYQEVVGKLQDDEKDYLYVYEDTVKSLVRDDAYQAAIEETLHEHKSPIEQSAIKETERRENFLNHDKTIRGLVAEEVETIIKGEQPVGHDFISLYEEMTK